MLDDHGKISVAEVVIYIPVGLFCIYNNIRYGFRRDLGWIYLTLFCIIKIAGSIMTIEIEQGNDTSMATTATILNTVALSPLLNASLSFLNVGSKHEDGSVHTVSRILRPVHILIIVGLALSILGGINRTHTAQSDLDTGAKELQIASAVFFLVWIALAIAAFVYITNIRELEMYGRRLVVSVSLAMPLLLVRIVYSALNAFNLDTSTSTGHTGEFNPVTGSWVIYLVLGMCPEVLVSALYTLTGLLNFSKSDRRKSLPEYSEMNPLNEDPTYYRG